MGARGGRSDGPHGAAYEAIMRVKDIVLPGAPVGVYAVDEPDRGWAASSLRSCSTKWTTDDRVNARARGEQRL